MKILHVITGLNQGGAERQLANLVSLYPNESAVFSLMKAGIMAEEIHRSGVPIYSGNVKRNISPAWILALRNAIKDFRPDVVMGWMYHGNLAASLTRHLGYEGPVVWNVRHSVHDIQLEKNSTRWTIRAGAWWSKSPNSIIYNSTTAAVQHELLGYSSEKKTVLPNGFDLTRFMPSTNARNATREAFRIPPNYFVLGVVGRSHPMKNHLGWLKAFQILVDEGLPVHCVMVGAGVADSDGPLVSAVRRIGLESSITLLPPTESLENLYPAFDLIVMPSLWGEGFPNVVGEAMACGVPALVTNVGDAAVLVDNTGFVASSSSTAGLANSARDALALGMDGLAELGIYARERMVSYYEAKAVASSYRRLFFKLL